MGSLCKSVSTTSPEVKARTPQQKKSVLEHCSESAKKEPQKRKKKKTFQDQVFHTMLNGCKPYTLKTLGYATKSTEETLNSLMLSLIDKGYVYKREIKIGKTGKVLYWANQDIQ